MPAIGRLRNLTTVMGSFHGRVLAARLGAEGVLVVLKGASDGPYPLQGEVEVLVPIDQLELAREILLADAVDEVFVESESSVTPPPAETSERQEQRRARVHGLAAALVVVVVITLIVVALVAAAH